MIELCAPAIIYLIFSITQILIDTYKGLYNVATVKIIVTVMVTLLLNILCDQELTIVSWIIVFIPFIFMTVVTSLILYMFGLNATSGKEKDNGKENDNVTIDINGNIIIYDPSYDPQINPAYYNSPNIIISNPNLHPTQTPTNASTNKKYTEPIPYGSSSPAYYS